jgi:hypothetical protein
VFFLVISIMLAGTLIRHGITSVMADPICADIYALKQLNLIVGSN